MRLFRSVVTTMLLALVALPLRAGITLNLKDADLNTLILAVSEITGKNFIVDPQVKGRVTVISSTPMDDGAIYQTFLAVLQTQGYVAVPAGGAIKIMPEAEARSDPGAVDPRQRRSTADDVVTRVFQLRSTEAPAMVPLLRPLLSSWAHLAAYGGTNSLIASDRAGNIARVEEIIRQLDQSGDRAIDSVPLQHAAATEVVKLATALLQGNKPAEGGLPAAVVGDERSNTVFVAGDRSARGQLLELIRRLDQPGLDRGSTQVIYLRYASAENLASVIEGYARKIGSGGKPEAAGATGGGNPEVNVVADKDTNALVVTAAPQAMRQIREVIAQLDIQRAQVLVEAIIAEVSATKQSQLGLNFAAFNPSGAGITSVLDASVLSALGAFADRGLSAAVSALGPGISIGGGDVRDGGRSGTSFAVLLRALQGDGDTNVLSTPSLVSLDNQESEVSVGQEVPFLSGSYSNSGNSGVNGAVNPFQTIERKDVGLKLGVTPQINEGNTVKLKIKLESSSVAAGTAGTADLITNKRTITNTVNVDSGQVLVLGGLIDDSLNESRSGLPYLSHLPVLGSLFSYRAVNKIKRNLMVFIHPVILRGSAAADAQTRRKYDSVRQVQMDTAKKPIPLLGGQRPLLLQLDSVMAGQPLPATGAQP